MVCEDWAPHTAIHMINQVRDLILSCVLTHKRGCFQGGEVGTKGGTSKLVVPGNTKEKVTLVANPPISLYVYYM